MGRFCLGHPYCDFSIIQSNVFIIQATGSIFLASYVKITNDSFRDIAKNIDLPPIV